MSHAFPWRRGRSKRGAAPGFSLLEVMVALAIMGASLVLLIELFGSGLKTAIATQEFTEAVFLATTKMEEALAQPEINDGSTSGRVEGSPYRWQVSITERELELPEGSGRVVSLQTQLALETKLHDVVVRVSWGGRGERGKSYELRSLRLSMVR